MWSLQLRGNHLIWAIAACCCQGFLLQGYDQGVMSGIIGADNQFGRDFNHPEPGTQGTIVAIYDIGCAVGCLFAFFLGERIGRKRMIMLGSSIMLAGTAILTSSTTFTQLIAGRIVTGLGNGCNSSSISMYQSETCGGAVRGTLICLDSATAVIGLAIAYWLDYGMSFVSGPAQWRLPVGFQAVFALLLLIQISMLPESPRWCMAHGLEEEGARILAMLAGKDSVEDPEVTLKRKEIEVSLAQESAGGPFRYSELVQNGKIANFRRICLCAGVQFMQQFTGTNMISYLAPIVYQNTMGMSRNLSLILGGATACMYILASSIPLWTVDRYGRRVLLMISSGGISLCFVLTAVLLSTGTRPAAFGATAMIFLFQVFLAVGFHPISWLYPAEISTTRIRTRGSAISASSNWMSTFVIVEITPIAIANIGWKVFIIFAIINATWVPIIYAFFPETKGLELEDIDHIFDKGGLTGGVWSSPGGRTVQRKRIDEDIETKEGSNSESE